MSEEIQRWLEKLATSEAQLKRFRKKVRELEEKDTVTEREVEEVRQEINADYESVKLPEIGMDVDEDEYLTEQERADLVEGERTLREYNEQVLTEFGVPIKGKKLIREGGTKKAFLLESVKSLEWLEGDGANSSKFSGIALVADAESANGRYYSREVCQAAVDRANAHIDELTVEMGHPKDENDTSPERIIGGFSSWDLNDNNEVTFKGEFNDTRLGQDARKLAKSRVGVQALSLRAGGELATERAPDGHRRQKVVSMELAGLDLVKAGGFGKARITNIGESKENLVEIMPRVSIPKALNEEADAKKVQVWLINNGYGEVPLESLTEIGFS